MMTDPDTTAPRDEPACPAKLTDKACTGLRSGDEPAEYTPPRDFPADDRAPCQQPADW